MSGLPRGWAETPIGELVELNPKNTCDDNTEVGFVPMPLMGTTYLSKLAYERRQWREVKKGYTHFADGDVLLGKITPCFENGKAGLASDLPNALGAGSTEYFVFRPRPTLYPRYLLAYFKTRQFMSNGAVEMTGSVGHKRVPKNYVTETKIPLAPLPEQKRIADKLDSVLARVDACRDRLDRLPALLKRFRQSILAAATSGWLTEDWRVENNSNDPVQVTLREILKVSSGNFLPAKNMAEGGKVPVYGGNGVNGYHNESNVSEETLLIGRVGYYCGSVHLTPNQAWVTDNALIVRHDQSETNRRFLFYALQAIDLRVNDSSTAQPVISGQKIYPLEMQLPSLLEQTEIVRRIEILFAFADRLEARLATARRQVGQLTPALLAKAFRGELVAQDPADEPAAELLKRLAAQREAAPKAKRGRASKA